MNKVHYQNRPTLHLPDLYLGKLKQMSSQDLHSLLSGNPKHAAVWIRMAANQGICEAQLRLGRMLLAGEGLSKNEAAAFAWFARAAATGDADALNMLGRCYENGWGVCINPTLAFENFRRSAQLGHDWAQYNLGHCYLDGQGVAQNHFLAFDCYQQAAAQGHGRAMNLLARCYEEGWGTAQNTALAHTWYRKSAESGYFRGQYNWASILNDAGQFQQAADWYLQAAQNGTQNVRNAAASALMAGTHPKFKAYSLLARKYCSEQE